MITHKTMYELHHVELSNKISEVVKDLELLNKNKDTIEQYLLTKENVTLDLLKASKVENIYPAVLNEDKFFNLRLNTYYNIVKSIETLNNTLSTLKKHKLPKNVFTFIIRRFNELLIEELIYNKYQFKSLFLGGLYVICNKNKHKLIDWKQSEINKKKLLSEGKVPYLKSEDLKAKENNKPYNGEQWLAYGSDYSFFFNWDLNPSQFARVPNVRDFTFVPLRGNNSPVKKLSNFKKTFTTEIEAINYYKTSNNDS